VDSKAMVLSDIIKQDDYDQIKSFYKMSGVSESKSGRHLV
jgi:hypothetical protein